jgi:peptide/nickel transport system substrate-binding protein
MWLTRGTERDNEPKEWDMKYKLKSSVLFALAALAAGVLWACQGTAEERAVTFALSGDPGTLDPQLTASTLSFQVSKSLYDTLVETDVEGVISPALATRWRVSEDMLVWTFDLRGGVTFHDGEELTSADVKATFERIQGPISVGGGDEPTASPKASEYSSIRKIEVIDDDTVALQLSEPSSSLLGTLASGWSAILPAHLIESGHDFGSLPVGTGPFTLQEWIRDSSLLLKKNEDYWMRGLPRIDTLTIQIIPEEAVKLQGLLAGQLDIADRINPVDRERVSAHEDLKLQERFTSMVFVVAMNLRTPVLQDLKVRQAITTAIDKQAVLDVAYGGGQVVGTFMDYDNSYYVDFTSLYPHDAERARSLLREGGWDPQTELRLVVPQQFEPHIKAGEIVQEMLSKVGIKTRLQIMESWLADAYRGGNFDLFVIAHTGKLDPHGRLKGYGAEGNYVGWINEEAASLIDEAKSTVGFKARKKLYDQVLELMARQIPHVYLGTSFEHVPMSKNVEGFRVESILDTYDFRRVTIR